MKHTISCLFACLFFPAIGMAQSQEQSVNLTNSATVLSSCSIATVNNIMFPNVNVLSSQSATGQGAVRVMCTKGSYNLAISNGSNASTTYSGSRSAGTDGNGWNVWYWDYTCGRAMKHDASSARISYQLSATVNGAASSNTTSTGPTRAQSQGGTPSCGTTASGATKTFAALTFNSPDNQLVNIYASMTAPANTPAGNYLDQLSVVVTF